LSATSPPQQTKMSRQLEDEQMARVGAGEGSGSGKEGGAGVVHRKWATITCSRVH
jgi:ribosomal protein L15